MDLKLKDFFGEIASPYPIEYCTVDIYLQETDLGEIVSKTGRSVSRKKVVCVLANKHWSDREVLKYSEYVLDHYEYFPRCRKLYVYLKGDLEI